MLGVRYEFVNFGGSLALTVLYVPYSLDSGPAAARCHLAIQVTSLQRGLIFGGVSRPMSEDIKRSRNADLRACAMQAAFSSGDVTLEVTG